MRDFITYGYLLHKNYLNLSYANKIDSPMTRRYLTVLANANIEKRVNLKNKKNNIYSTTFETVIVSSSLTLSTAHSILSPIDTSIILAIVAGNVVLTELLVDDPLLIFVFCLNNNVITSDMFLFILIFVTSVIYNFAVKVIFLKVTFIYYQVQSYNYRQISHAATC